jgi:phenylacetate-CoA ligase
MSRHAANPGWLNRAYVNVFDRFLNGRSAQSLRTRLSDYCRQERLSLEENQRLQWIALTRLLHHAYETTPFYRHRFDKLGAHPTDIRSEKDLLSFPPLTREDIRNNIENLWSRIYQKDSLLPAATGGTTDTPVPLLRSPDCLEEKRAVQLHFDTWAGMWPGDKVFMLWGAAQDYNPNPSLRWKLYDRYVARRVWAPTSRFNAEILESHRRLMNGFRPKIVYAYPTPLTLFCEYLASCGKPFHKPVAAICTAEPLLEPQRKIIESVLGCAAFEHYGTRDFGMVGAECEAHQGMHFHPAAVKVELLPVEGSEDEPLYEMLVTDLLNYGMPLVRYRINDCAVLAPHPCDCGRGFPLVRNIVGRTVDNFRLADGTVVPGVSLTNRVIQVCPGLSKLQIIQRSLDDFHVRYVPGPGFSQKDLSELSQKLYRFFPIPLNWTFEEVKEIAREKSGKTRFCISYVSDVAAASSGAASKVGT